MAYDPKVGISKDSTLEDHLEWKKKWLEALLKTKQGVNPYTSHISQRSKRMNTMSNSV